MQLVTVQKKNKKIDEAVQNVVLTSRAVWSHLLSEVITLKAEKSSNTAAL